MPVPPFEEYFLPFLLLLKDQKDHTLCELREGLEDYFNLSYGDRNELSPSGKETKHANRVKWTRTYLREAGLIDNIGRGKVKINEEGLEVLSQNPKKVNIKFLKKYPEFCTFRKRGKPSEPDKNI